MTIEPVQILQLLIGSGAAIGLGKMLLNIGGKMREMKEREERLDELEQQFVERESIDAQCVESTKAIEQLKTLRVRDASRISKIERFFSSQYPRVRGPSQSRPELLLEADNDDDDDTEEES